MGDLYDEKFSGLFCLPAVVPLAVDKRTWVHSPGLIYFGVRHRISVYAKTSIVSFDRTGENNAKAGIYTD